MRLEQEMQNQVRVLSDAEPQERHLKTEVPCWSNSINECVNVAHSFLIWTMKSLPTSYCLAWNDKQVSLPCLIFHQDVAGLQGHLKTDVYLCSSSQQVLCRGIHTLLLFKASIPS